MTGADAARDPPPDAVLVDEVRLLDGPNLYFTRPAVKVSLSLPGYLAAEQSAMREIADRTGMRRAAPGEPHTEQRHRFVVRLTSTVVRLVADRLGSRLGVRGRPGPTADAVVVAFPWRHRNRAVTLGQALGPLLSGLLDGADAWTLVDEAARTLRQTEPGDPPAQVRPRVPVASVTGTNGKTSTTRLLAHMGMTCGRRTGWSSTEGVYVQGEQLASGDFSGPSGARYVLDDPGVQLAVLETARGGLLLKGMGVSHNDVSVVTNVTADHLGLHGIDTLDQLAEVKAIITRVTRKTGWVVLNGDDPRVRAMSIRASGRIWMFSLDPDSPALREALELGGRGITVLDGDVVTLALDADPDRLLPILDVPMTLSGLSKHSIANALAATAAALGLGLPRDGVVDALRSFVPDLHHNPGRMNVWSVPLPAGGSGTVIVDIAHNEAGLEALLDVAEGLRPPGARVHLCLGGVGDRTDAILSQLGELGGRRADRVHIARKTYYLRGRTVEDLEAQLVRGLAAVGAVATGTSPTEVDGLRVIVDTMTDGDVAAMMCHAERSAVVQWLEERGAHQDTATDIGRKVVAARGEHHLEAEIAALTGRTGGDRVQGAQLLHERTPGDPRLMFEVASALDADGQHGPAAEHYRAALAAGLRDPHRFRAQVGLARALRALGQHDEAADLLAELAAQRPDSATVVVLQALSDVDHDDPWRGVSRLVDYLMAHATGIDDSGHRDMLTAAARDLLARLPATRG